MNNKQIWMAIFICLLAVDSFSDTKASKKSVPPELVVPQFDFEGAGDTKKRDIANQDDPKDLLSELEGLLDNPAEREAKTQLGVPEGINPLPQMKVDNPPVKVDNPPMRADNPRMRADNPRISVSKNKKALAEQKKQKPKNEITSVEFFADEKVKKLVIGSLLPLKHRLSTNKKSKQLVYFFEKTSVSRKVRRTYETKEFNIPLEKYTLTQLFKKKVPMAQLVFKMREISIPKISQMENQLTFEFVNLSPERFVASELPSSSLNPDAFDLGTGYKGEVIEKLELKNTDVGEAIKLVLSSTGYSVVFNDEVKGNISSLSLRNIPWDQALHIILRLKKLGFVRTGHILRIASLDSLKMEQADLEKQEDLEPLKTVILPVSYAKANTLLPRATNFLSTRGKIDVDDRTNTLIIRDRESSITRLQKLFSVLDTQPPMISISAKFLEVKKSFSRTLGLGSLSMSGQTSGINFGTPQAGVAGPGLSAGPGGGSVNLSAPKFAALNAQLVLAENQNKVKTLSNPTIVVQQGQAGNITQGTTINIPQALGLGGAVTTPLAVTANLNLTVTPVVGNDGSISLDTNISDATANPTAGGGITTSNRALRTQIILLNGDTAVLGGISAGTESVTSGGIPFFKDLPLLGYLFGQNLEKRDQSEVLIFITARILNPEAAFKQTL